MDSTFPVDVSHYLFMEQCMDVSPEHAHFTVVRWIPTSNLLTLDVSIRVCTTWSVILILLNRA